MIAGTGQRFGCNMISAITNRGHLCFMVFKRKFRLNVFLQFLRRLLKQAGTRRVFLIVDGHPVHRAGSVRKWIEAQQGKIELFFLPAYRPDLNPDEFVWAHMKTNGVSKKPLKQNESLRRRIEDDLIAIMQNRKLVRSFFCAPSVTYAKD